MALGWSEAFLREASPLPLAPALLSPWATLPPQPLPAVWRQRGAACCWGRPGERLLWLGVGQLMSSVRAASLQTLRNIPGLGRACLFLQWLKYSLILREMAVRGGCRLGKGGGLVAAESRSCCRLLWCETVFHVTVAQKVMGNAKIFCKIFSRVLSVLNNLL